MLFLLLRSSWNFTNRYALWREVNWLSFKTTSSLLTELWRHKMSDIMSKIDDVISPLKMSALLWRRTILWENWRGPIFEKFLSRTKGDSPYPGEVILCTLAWMWLKITLNNKIKGTNQNASSLQELLRWNENILQNLKIMHIWRHNYVKIARFKWKS